MVQCKHSQSKRHELEDQNKNTSRTKAKLNPSKHYILWCHAQHRGYMVMSCGSHKVYSGPASISLPVLAYVASHLGCLHLLSAFFLSRYSMLLLSLTSWGFH